MAPSEASVNRYEDQRTGPDTWLARRYGEHLGILRASHRQSHLAALFADNGPEIPIVEHETLQAK